ncbi:MULTISPECIES: hypothetical protein [Shinella]|jgi:hypothetical protein|uniref:hypothetical protein n=2 Tax=Rhizobiaceae TaxID=82115 RepID=UPI001F5849D1|nr:MULTISPECIES: hypothetical protein [Shinella]CAI0341898.1 conserved hypothetical protein [Rhizobiaceae bacterium]CAK7262356.1 conserved protein of unknown function [Shinella sp. WSC3-e]
MMAPHPANRLLILACSATKRDGPAYMPAIERYDGPLWQTLRSVDPRGEKAKVAFLSARLGFRAAATPIEMYDARMTPAIAAEMKAGDLGTRWPKQKTRRRGMASGEHPGMHIATLTGYGRVPFSDVALVGGHLYLDVMRHLVDLFRERGHIVGDARITEVNGPIGIMRRDLRRWLDREFVEGH